MVSKRGFCRASAAGFLLLHGNAAAQGRFGVQNCATQCDQRTFRRRRRGGPIELFSLCGLVTARISPGISKACLIEGWAQDSGSSSEQVFDYGWWVLRRSLQHRALLPGASLRTAGPGTPA